MKAGRGGIESGEAPLWCFHETSADLEDPVTGSQCSGQDHHALEKLAQSRIYDPTRTNEMLERGGRIILHNTYKPRSWEIVHELVTNSIPEQHPKTTEGKFKINPSTSSALVSSRK